MTIRDALKGISGYPIPQVAIDTVCTARGISPDNESDTSVAVQTGYRLAQADLMVWLALAPNVTQGGQSYSLSDEQRTRLRSRAQAIYSECGDASVTAPKTVYGYKGSRL